MPEVTEVLGLEPVAECASHDDEGHLTATPTPTPNPTPPSPVNVIVPGGVRGRTTTLQG